MKKIIAIIPARSGSKGLKNKNILNLYGKPLINWSVQFAIKNKYIDECIVSTDCLKIANCAKDSGAKVPFIRDKKLASDTAKTSEVIIDVINKCELDKNDLIVLLEPTSPYRLMKSFEKCLDILKTNNYKKLVSIQEAVSNSYRFQFFKNSEGSLININNSNLPNDVRRQDIKKTFYLDGSFYFSKISSFIESPGFLELNTYGFINDFFSGFEIDNIQDLNLMEAIFLKNGAPF